MSNRYYIESPIDSPSVTLHNAEAHHLLHVMRAKVGQQVVLFDGSGAEFTAEVVGLRRGEAELRVLSRAEIDRELPCRLTLAVALPKGERQRWLVEKAVELGVSQLIPLATERGVAQPVDSALERLSRFVIEASKQCGRNRLMQITAPQTCDALFADISPLSPCGRGVGGEGWESPLGSLRWIAHPYGSSLRAALVGVDFDGVPASSPRDIFLAVGPEGGFADEEASLATAAGWQCVSLGRRILRVETAAIALVAAVAAHFDQ